MDATIHQGNRVKIERFPGNWISIDRSAEAADVQKQSGEAVRCNLCSFTPLLFESIWPKRADIWLSARKKVSLLVSVVLGRLYLAIYAEWFIWAEGNTVHKLCFAKRFKELYFRGTSESLTLRIFVSLGSDGQFNAEFRTFTVTKYQCQTRARSIISSHYSVVTRDFSLSLSILLMASMALHLGNAELKI